MQQPKVIHMAATPALSEDIIGEEILTRLPVKSILRFRSVCKSWKSMFSSSDFINSHLNLASQNPNNDGLVISKIAHRKDPFCVVSILHNYNSSETIISDVLNYGQLVIRMLGSVNGLVCLFIPGLEEIIIWNPSTRKSKKLYIPLQIRLSEHMSGLCWDSVSNDYKVVMHFNRCRDWFVYSCNADCWKQIPKFSFPSSDSHPWTPGVIVNGVPFWRFSKNCKEKNICRSSIVKFDVGCDEFSLLPEFAVDVDVDSSIILVSLKDCLTALLYNTEPLYNNVCTSNSLVNAYCLDEGYGVWRKMYSFGPITSCAIPFLDCFNYGGEILFDVSGKKFSYDRKTNKIKGFNHQKGQLMYCYSFKPSLVCVHGMEPLQLANRAL